MGRACQLCVAVLIVLGGAIPVVALTPTPTPTRTPTAPPVTPTNTPECVLSVVHTTDLGTLPHPTHVYASDGAFSVPVVSALGVPSIRWWFFDGLLNAATACAPTNPPVFRRAQTGPIAPVSSPLALSYSYDGCGFPIDWLPYTATELASYSSSPLNVIGAGNSGLTRLPSGQIAQFWVEYPETPIPSSPYPYLGIGFSTDTGATSMRVEQVFKTPDDPCIYSTAPFVVGAYVYLLCPTSHNATPFTAYDMYMARAPANLITTRAAYTFWTGSGWSSNINAAVPPVGLTGLKGSVFGTINWNSYLNRYLYVHQYVVGQAALAQTAQNPEGPWGPEQLLFQELNGVNLNYAANEHIALQQNMGQEIAVSYYRATNLSPFQDEVRLVTVDFDNTQCPFRTPTPGPTPTPVGIVQCVP